MAVSGRLVKLDTPSPLTDSATPACRRTRSVIPCPRGFPSPGSSFQLLPDLQQVLPRTYGAPHYVRRPRIGQVCFMPSARAFRIPIDDISLVRLVHRPVKQISGYQDCSPLGSCGDGASGQGADDRSDARQIPACRDPRGRSYGARGPSGMISI